MIEQEQKQNIDFPDLTLKKKLKFRQNIEI